MPRYVRNTAILAKTETTYKTDATPTGASDALLVSNLTINPLNEQNVSRNIIRPYFGGSEQLVGVANVQVSFDVELVGSGTAGTAPAWGKLLKACAFAETVVASTRVDYTPITTAVDSLSIYWYDDGVLHKLLGARGDASFKLNLAGIPVISYTFTGLYGGVSVASNPSVTLTAFKTPEVITDTNTGDITLGATHLSTGAPTLTGGTVYPSKGLEIMLGNSVNHRPLLGGETIEITGREVTGKMSLDLQASQEATFMSDVRANTLTSLGFTHGTVAGNKTLIFAPSVQRVDPAKQDDQGQRLIDFGLRMMPVNGNDELRIVTSF